MSEPTESFSGTDIDYVRVLLGQAGKEQMTVEIQEPQIAVTANKMYVNFQDIQDVVGVWAGSDINGTGTNYAGSGTTFDSRRGIITTSEDMTPGYEYIVTYSHQHGLTDRDIQRCLDDSDADIQVNLYVRDGSINYDTSTNIGKIAYALKLNMALLHCISLLNTGNMVQSGFNYALGELRVETKLWGEGMSADPLIRRIQEKIASLYDMLKLYYHDGISVIQIADRFSGQGRPSRNRLGQLIRTGSAHDWVMNGITVSEKFRVVPPAWEWY